MKKHQTKRLFLGLLLSTAIVVSFGCGENKTKQAVGPPVADAPKSAESPGTPILLFGSRGIRSTPGKDDPEYQEYLLWKEWRQYQKYQEWVKARERGERPNEAPAE